MANADPAAAIDRATVTAAIDRATVTAAIDWATVTADVLTGNAPTSGWRLKGRHAGVRGE